MSTDLRRALRDAVADEPTFVVEPRVLAHTGTHRLRRRNALVVGVAAVATAAVLVATSLVSRPSTSRPDPAPAERTVRLDLDDAVAVRPEVVASADIIAIREGMGGIYQGSWEEVDVDGDRVARHRFEYRESMVRRIVDVAIKLASRRNGRIHVVLKPGGIPSISSMWRRA